MKPSHPCRTGTALTFLLPRITTGVIVGLKFFAPWGLEGRHGRPISRGGRKRPEERACRTREALGRRDWSAARGPVIGRGETAVRPRGGPCKVQGRLRVGIGGAGGSRTRVFPTRHSRVDMLTGALRKEHPPPSRVRGRATQFRYLLSAGARASDDGRRDRGVCAQSGRPL